MAILLTFIVSLFQTLVEHVFKRKLDFILNRKEKKKQKKYSCPPKNKFLNVVSEISEILNTITTSTQSTRVMLLKCHNGGGIPKLDSPLYSTIILESFIKGEPERKNWEKQKLDSKYISVMVRLNNSPDGLLIVDKEEFKDSVLENLYEKNHIKESKLATIVSTHSGWYYLSINFSNTIDKLDATQQEVLRSKINQLRNLLMKNKDLL